LKDSNPLIYIGHLLFGCFSLILSLVIVLHTVFCIVPGTLGWGDPANTFLDGMLSNVSKYGAFLLGALVFIFLAVYMQLAILKGLNVPFYFGIGVFWGRLPFTVNGTWMNAF
jgi:hypothetical protein